jgi:hypothetical protein
MRHFPLRECGYALGVVVLLAAIYVGSYYATVQPKYFRMPPGDRACLVEYRLDDEGWLKVFFAPMHDLDRQIRPEWWEDEVPFASSP